MNITRYEKLLLLLTAITLSACSGENQNSVISKANTFSDACPPAPKSNVSVIQRVDGMANFERYSKWQKELPPKSCAGPLGSYIPDLPPGYALPPNIRPPIMTEGHVYLKYVQIPENLNDDALELINFGDNPQFEFEIVQLNSQQASTFKEWFINNPKSYTSYDISGRRFYGVGGGGWYLPGNKLSGGIGTILNNNVLIKFSMPGMYSDESVPTPVAQLFHEIAVKNGL